MKIRIGGQRPRPRVALLGKFDDLLLKKMKEMFPTIWHQPNLSSLQMVVDKKEVDLIIIEAGVQDIPGWVNSVHVICFSHGVSVLPGPHSGDHIKIGGRIATEEYIFPDIPLNLNRLREVDLKSLRDIKGWSELDISHSSNTSGAQDKKASKLFLDGSVINDRYTGKPLATIFTRPETKLGVAWLPNPIFDRISWINTIVTDWAKEDEIRFPGFADWTSSPEWMIDAEISIINQIREIEEKKVDVIAAIDKEINSLSTALADENLKANQGRRRLITAQGDELVDEVEKIFQLFGFRVERVDDALKPGVPKREDLRLTDDSDSTPWEAIVEVRGYTKSGGTTADLTRLARFASFYQSEKDRLPDKQIYVVNGQIELLPSERQIPLASAQEDINVFSENSGLIISSLDLFRASQSVTKQNIKEIKESIKVNIGRWIFSAQVV